MHVALGGSARGDGCELSLAWLESVRLQSEIHHGRHGGGEGGRGRVLAIFVGIAHSRHKRPRSLRGRYEVPEKAPCTHRGLAYCSLSCRRSDSGLRPQPAVVCLCGWHVGAPSWEASLQQSAPHSLSRGLGRCALEDSVERACNQIGGWEVVRLGGGRLSPGVILFFVVVCININIRDRHDTCLTQHAGRTC